MVILPRLDEEIEEILKERSEEKEWSREIQDSCAPSLVLPPAQLSTGFSILSPRCELNDEIRQNLPTIQSIQKLTPFDVVLVQRRRGSQLLATDPQMRETSCFISKDVSSLTILIYSKEMRYMRKVTVENGESV